jgi:nucleotide-binding universal stress UspA family protein
MAQVSTILFASDLSAESDRALSHAAALAQALGSSLLLYHAVPLPEHAYAHWAFAHGHDIWQEAERGARECVERQAAGLPGRVEVLVERVTSVPRAVLSLIRSRQPDLTVMATHGRRGLSHVLLGSVAETVFRQAHRPVLCVRPAAHGERLPYRRVLMPTDFSPASRLAAPLAALLARTFGAEVVGLHVEPGVSLGGLVGAAAPRDPMVPSAASVSRFLAPDFAEVAFSARVERGTVWSRIVETARAVEADLVVMATRGHDSVGDAVLGSTTDRVVRHAPCPVLVA